MIGVDPRRARWIRFRMGILCGLMGLGLGVVVSSAWTVQVESGAEWRDLAEKQRQRRLHIVPKRGTVYDRNGTPLAVSVEVPSVSVDSVELLRGVDDRHAPPLVREVSARIARSLALDPAEVERKVAARRRFAWLKRRLSVEEVAAVREMTDPRSPHFVRGIQLEGEGHRYYPNRDLLGPVLGFVAPDGEGKDGIELELDGELRGRVEEVRGLRDRAGRLLFHDAIQDEQALAGHDVYLTIDRGIQYAAEQELAAAARMYEASGGTAVVVDPGTGDVLAMANYPSYNPNDYAASEVDARRNRAIADRFEPGSTMKVFTVSAGMAGHAISPTQTIYCEQGQMVVDNVTIHDTHQNGWLTPTQVLAMSSNIGAAKVGLLLGEGQLYEWFRRFGFGEPTGIGLPGEGTGVLRPRGRPWVQVETAAASFGQGVSVTALQLAMGVSVIANGGRLLEPVLVRRVAQPTGETIRDGITRSRREALSAGLARTIAEMMVAVTEGEGTGVEAAMPGFRVAGKTATAQKADPATGRYTTDKFVSSFIGFVPADRPRVTIVVVLDEPMVARAGGAVAAPTFRRIAEAALRQMGVTPHGTQAAPLAEVGKEPDRAEVTYQALREARGDVPPAPPEPQPAGRPPPGAVKVPDMRGWTVREAVKSAIEAGLAPSVEGSGQLLRQDPPAGASIPKGAPIKLVFEPPT